MIRHRFLEVRKVFLLVESRSAAAARNDLSGRNYITQMIGAQRCCSAKKNAEGYSMMTSEKQSEVVVASVARTPFRQ